MKYIIFFLVLLFSVLPPAYSQQTNSQNYIISRNYKQAGANANDVSKVVTQVQYLDALGRPNQNVTVGQSPAGTDIVEPIVYDAVGRQAKQYLPYVATGNGSFKTNAISEQAIWYSNNSAGLQYDPASPLDLDRAYNETIYQPSPLNRPSNIRGPGTKSPLTYLSYSANAGPEVKQYVYAANSDIFQSISETSSYIAGTLQSTQTNDENNYITLEFTNRQGKLVCKRVFASANEEMSTYYVYDKLDQLRAVLQPQFQVGADPVNVKLANFAFLYEYDAKGRMIRKNVPGAGITEYVYDNFDHAVLSRNAGQTARNVWAFTKFDALNRPIMTGELNSDKPRSEWQTKYDAVTAHHENKPGTGETGYSLNLTSVATATGFPQITDANVLTVTYYDDYSFPKPAGFDYSSSTGYPASFNNAVKSHVTGGKARILAGNSATAGEWRTNVIYYDAEYRTIQTVRDLYDMGSNAVERVSIQYKYDLAPVIAQQKTVQVVGGVTHSHEAVYSYDHADRLTLTKETVSAGSKTKTAYTLAQQYNTLGQLKNKWFHAYSSDQLKYRTRTDHVNNIRGWLTDAKTVYKERENQPDLPFYRLALAYDNVNLASSYSNGNISSMLTSGKDETALTKGLSFSYDPTNRLTGVTGLGGYAETESGITYDLNGNIKTLNRGGAAIDNLTYSYTGTGNRLKSVTDGSASNTGVKSGTSSYDYDANGNMTSDGNRGAVITYNYLNLPKTVVVGGKTLTYDYDASGLKHKYSGDGITAKYAGIFEYDANNVFKRAATSTGQLVLSGDTLRFDYYIKDHLGNTRVVFTEAGDIIQKTDYSPFGLEIDRNPIPATTDALKAERNGVNRYNFLGKETQFTTGYVDLQARFYDPATGRFMQVDPETEGQLEFSSYHYSFNNPIRFSDPDGKFPGEGVVQVFNAIKKWWNTPLTKGQQNASRGLNISFSGQDYASKTRGEALLISIGQGIRHGMSHGLPGNSKTTGLPKNVMNGPAGKSTKAGSAVSTTPNAKPSGPVAGGGAKLENISGEVGRIQSIANKYDLEINVVGSRASGQADNLSDWDYIIFGGNAKARSSALFQLPRNLNATKDGMPRPGSELLKGVDVNPELPHITFKPEQNE